ncbi:MAG: ribonuclease III domain-containing protein [Candidatus Gastranaerophilales bacterium]|nr:ribonuclease III domain-containing protein [Candidatus Gastranaerophilales bacterium]
MDKINLRNYAYLGDAVWELFVREKTILKTQNANELHKITTDKVNARIQQELLLRIQKLLTDEELGIIRRSRNLPIPVARKANQAEYRMATAFEALIGWWYKNDKTRLAEIEEILSEYL